MSKRRKEDVDWRKFTTNKSFKYAIAGFGTSVIAGVLFYVGKPVVMELNDSFAIKEFKQIGIVGTYKKHYHKLFDQLETLANADAREQHLVRELASVQKDFEVEKAKNAEDEASSQTHEIAERLKTEAGSSLARIPDGIEYEAPTEILPHQLQVLGIEYFRKHDYEKSAVIFHELFNLKGDVGYQKPENYLISAISWYKLKHFEKAADYLKLTQKNTAPGSQWHRQSLVWQAMLEKARGNQKASQQVLTQLLSYYPQSEEANWINHSRTPASKKVEKEEVHAEKHEAVQPEKHEDKHHEEHHHE